MIITLFSIFAAVVLCYIIKEKCKSDDDFCGWAFISVTTLCLVLILHVITYPINLKRQVITTTEKIVAMKSDSKIEGEMRGGLFFYRCRIDEVDYYMYLTESDGVYKQKNVPVERTVIKETGGQPKISRTIQYTRNMLPNFIRFKLNQNPEKVIESDTIFVPEGTISECSKYVVF